jgi:CheY-like chemotaxis protein
MVHTLPFDIVLMDVQMPEMDGIEATKYIRENLVGKRDLPIIALTASVIKTEIDRAMAAGMNDYVPKPFKKDELLTMIGRYYKGRGAATTPPPSKPVETVIEPVAQPEPTPEPLTKPQPQTPAMSTNGQHEPVADLTSLSEITGGNAEQLKKYIKMFLDGVPSQLEAVGVALSASDFDGVRRRIHAMKPHLKFMGMKTAAEYAESIEQLSADQKDPDRVHAEFAKVKQQCEWAFEELRAKL